MGRWTYYSPLWLGALLVVALNDELRAALPPWAPWAQWTAVALTALVFGVQCQLLMIGAQGAFAQVLPVPWGKSIRGGAAVVVGTLLIAWNALGLICGSLLRHEVYVAGLVLAGLSLLSLLGAIVTYVWSLPAAVADFGNDKRF